MMSTTAFPSEEHADQDVVGVFLDVPDNVGFDPLAYLLWDAVHETKARQVGNEKVLAGPVVVVRLAGDARALTGREVVARDLAHQGRFADVRPAREDYLAVSVGPCFEHVSTTRLA